VPAGSSRLPPSTGTAPEQPAAGIAKPAGSPSIAPSPQESLRTFDYRHAAVEWADDRWQLKAAGVLLKDFGRHEAEARQALRVLQELHLTQMGAVGTPLPIMEYWLADGHAPQGFVSELRTLPLDPRTLKAEQLQGQWWVRDAHRVLFNFGGHEDEARQALAVLQHYGFTQVGYVGQAAPLMIVLLGTSAGSDLIRPAALPSPSAAATQGEMPAPPGFPARRGAGRPGAETGPNGGAGAGNALAPVPLPLGRQLAQPATNLPDLTDGSERLPIDWRQIHARQDRGGSRLVMGGATLADFGPNYSDARLAEDAVRFYRFTEQRRIGRPRPVFTYFLVNGQAPHGAMLGADVLLFQPDALAVRQLGNDWAVCEGTQPLFHFGANAEEARQALRAIQHYQFDAVCRIGHSEGTAFTFPVRTH
jgi:hypothetical protein